MGKGHGWALPGGRRAAGSGGHTLGAAAAAAVHRGPWTGAAPSTPPPAARPRGTRSAGSRCSGPPRPGTPGRPGRRAPSGVRPARRRAAGPPDGQGSSRSAVCGAVTRPPSAHRRRAGQVDAEVGGEHEGEAAVPLSVRFLLVGGDAGADEAGGGAVEGEVTAVRGVVLREADGGGGAGGAPGSVAWGACTVGSGGRAGAPRTGAHRHRARQGDVRRGAAARRRR
ncbi:hypothetical protein SLI_4335 [Streptomyces lividans 1326]|uniref:Uncharacterized protein n=1 Tax=Streptomyces lividans 1326 TaxID=1200984 RepID=A0A7U9HC68_STRLI|nr:hypothetical protein SLI_4335 [Streptomyces lividans 1326]